MNYASYKQPPRDTTGESGTRDESDARRQTTTRYTLTEHGELADRNGNILTLAGLQRGRVVELVLETSSGGDTGGAFKAPKPQTAKDQQQETSKELPVTPQISAVWGHYERLIGKGRRQLKKAQIRDIERALKVRDLEQVKAAITGLAHSPHHNGRNDTGAKYLDIRYALRGNSQRGETPEERIDRMAALAGQVSSLPTSQLRDRGTQQPLVDQWTNRVRLNSGAARYGDDWDQDTRAAHDAMRTRQRDEAIAELAALGVSTRFLDGRPVFEDQA
jgi:hypothetical protein